MTNPAWMRPAGDRTATTHLALNEMLTLCGRRTHRHGMASANDVPWEIVSPPSQADTCRQCRHATAFPHYAQRVGL